MNTPFASKARTATFTRSLVLPKHVDASRINAEAKDGVLRIHIPKAETKKSETLAIEVH
jgi:HSP20 family protein